METVYYASAITTVIALLSLLLAFLAWRRTQKLSLRQKRSDVLVTCVDLRLSLETLIDDIQSSMRLIPEDDPKLKSRLRQNHERVSELRAALEVFRTRIIKALAGARARAGVLIFLEELDEELLKISDEIATLAKEISDLRSSF